MSTQPRGFEFKLWMLLVLVADCAVAASLLKSLLQQQGEIERRLQTQLAVMNASGVNNSNRWFRDLVRDEWAHYREEQNPLRRREWFEQATRDEAIQDYLRTGVWPRMDLSLPFAWIAAQFFAVLLALVVADRVAAHWEVRLARRFDFSD